MSDNLIIWLRFIMEWYSDFRKISLSRVWNVQGLLCSSFILVAFVSLAKAHLGTKECVLFVWQRYKGTFGHHSGAITLENVLLDHFFTSRSSGEAENKELEEKNDTNFHLEIIHNGNGEADVSAGQNVQVVLLEVLQQLPSDLNKFFLICSYLIFILPTTWTKYS